MTNFVRRAVGLLVATAALAAMPASAPAATWTAPATISSNALVGFDLAMGADGTAALAFVDDTGVRVAVRRPGSSWSAAQRVSDGRYGVSGVAVAVDGRGDVVTGWVQNGRARGQSGPIIGPLTIRSAIRHGAAWGAPRQVGTTGHFLDASLDAAANARGDAILSWTGVQRLSANRHVEALQSSFRAAGGHFGGTQTVREAEVPRGVSGPVVALDALGTATVAWTHEPGPVVRISARTRGPHGSWLAPRDAGATPSSNPQIVVTSERTSIVSWHAAGSDSEGDGLQSGALEVRQRTSDGRLGTTQRISESRTRTYRLAAAPSGETLLAYAGAEAPDLGLRIATRPPGGQFAPPTPIDAIRPDGFNGGAAYLGDGTALFAWGSDGRVGVISRAPGTGFGGTPEIDTPGLYPLIAASGTRGVVAYAMAAGSRVRLLALARR